MSFVPAMDNYCKILKKEDFITSNWSGGTTTQLFIYPEKSTLRDMDFQFRLSTAMVEQEESQFSKLENIQRFITPLDGTLKLSHDSQESIILKSFEIYEFEGNWNTKSYGKVKDFNFMLSRGTKGHLSSYFVKTHSPLVIETETGFNFIFTPFKKLDIIIGNQKFHLSTNHLLLLNNHFSNPIRVFCETEADLLHASILL